jgi:murein L,D-transpeptidase YcbB/YkuD
MKKIMLLMLVLSLPLAGCSLFETRKPDKRIETLDERVSTVEKRQDEIEDRLATDEGTGYQTNIEPKAGPAKTVAPASSRVSMSSKEIQTALKNAGYYYGAIDGKIGRMSRQAVKEFQEDHGLKVDGIVGPKTMEKLLPYLSEKVK